MVQEMPGDEVLDQEPGQDVTDDKVKNQHSYHYWHKHGKQRAELGDVAPPPKHELVEVAEVHHTLSIIPITRDPQNFAIQFSSQCSPFDSLS